MLGGRLSSTSRVDWTANLKLVESFSIGKSVMRWHDQSELINPSKAADGRSGLILQYTE